MAAHAARFALSPRARADDEIVTAGANGSDHVFDECRIVGAVAVHENDDIGIIGRLRAGEAGAAVAIADADHLGAGAARDVGRAVAAAAIGDDDPVDDVARQGGHDAANRRGFVEGRNDDGDAARRWRHG